MVTHMSVKLRERPVVRKAMRTGVPQRLLPLAFQLCAALLGWLGAGAPLLGGLRPLGLCFAAAVPTPYAVCAAAGAGQPQTVLLAHSGNMQDNTTLVLIKRHR